MFVLWEGIPLCSMLQCLTIENDNGSVLIAFHLYKVIKLNIAFNSIVCGVCGGTNRYSISICSGANNRWLTPNFAIIDILKTNNIFLFKKYLDKYIDGVHGKAALNGILKFSEIAKTQFQYLIITQCL